MFFTVDIGHACSRHTVCIDVKHHCAGVLHGVHVQIVNGQVSGCSMKADGQLTVGRVGRFHPVLFGKTEGTQQVGLNGHLFVVVVIVVQVGARGQSGGGQIEAAALENDGFLGLKIVDRFMNHFESLFLLHARRQVLERLCRWW